MKNKVSFFIFIIILCSAWNLAFAVEHFGEAKKYEEGTKIQQLQQLHLHEATEEDDSVAEISSAAARLTLEEGDGPQENNQAPEPSPEETLIAQFQTIVAGANFNEEQQLDLHERVRKFVFWSKPETNKT